MRDEGLYFDDMVEAAKHIRNFIDGLSRSDFLLNEMVQSAVIQKLTVIGEAASRISDATKANYDQIDWKNLKGFRNIAVHVYYELDWDVVWVTAVKHVPVLLKELTHIVESDYPFAEDTK